MSLTGGLIPLSGTDKSSKSSLSDMAPLTSVNNKKSSTISSGFDDFDDLLDAPIRNNKKNNKNNKSNNNNKKSKKKTGRGKNFDLDQSYDNFDEPDSPGGILSPNYGNSMEKDEFLKMDLPRGVGDGDLDDSILGGLMGGPPKASKGIIRPNNTTNTTSTLPNDNISIKKIDPIVTDPPIVQTKFPTPQSNTDSEYIARPPTNVGRRRAPRDWSTEKDNNDNDDILSSLTTPVIPKTQPDDIFGAPSIRNSTSSLGGRRGNTRGFSPEGNTNDNIDHFDDTPKPSISTPAINITNNNNSNNNNNNNKQKKGLDDWDDGSMDFDIDSLLPDTDKPKSKPNTTTLKQNEPSIVDNEQTKDMFKPKTTNNNINNNMNSNSSKYQPDPLDDSIDTSPIQPSISSFGNKFGSNRPKSAPTSTNQEKESIDDYDQNNGNNKDKDQIAPSAATTTTTATKSNNDDDVDLGFMPSFLEPGRESRSRRQIGRPKTSQERTLPANRFGTNNNSDDIDALDSALGLNKGKSVERSIKAVDPFSNAETNFQEKRAQRPATENMHRTDSFRLSHITSPDEKGVNKNNNTNNFLNNNLNEEKLKNDSVENTNQQQQQQQLQQRQQQQQQQAQQQLLLQAQQQSQSQQQTQNQNVPKVISHKPSNTFNFTFKKEDITNSTSTQQQQQQPSNIESQPQQQPQQQDQGQGLRLVALPSLTPPKPSNEPEFRDRDKNGDNLYGNQLNIKKQSNNNHDNHQSLSVQVEDSMDEPISYPPTSTYPTQQSSIEGDLYSKSPGKNYSGTVTFGPNITVAVPSNNNNNNNMINNNMNMSNNNNNNNNGIITMGTPVSAKKILKKSNSGSNELTSPQQQQQTTTTTTPKRHSMPTWLSPNNSIDLGTSTSPLNRSKDNAALRHAQEKLEEVTLQKDATEKYLRLEIESLKNKLESSMNNQMNINLNSSNELVNYSQQQQHQQQQSNLSSSSSSHYVSNSSHIVTTTNMNHIHEIEELKLKIQTLQEENRILKEEAMIDKIKHQREITHLKEKHQADLDLGNIAKVEEISLLERRHRDAIEALKKIHLDELNAIKQRNKDGEALEALTTKISATTGSLKLIEEQMNLKYKGIDAVREGQYEARERLLTEMEAKATERAEIAEAEGYKLKGLLAHMEKVVENLRSQGGEERERLRMEHRRLEAMQLNLQMERKLLQERTTEELTDMKRKMVLLEEREMNEIKKRAEETAEFNEMKRQFEIDKKEFASYVATNIKSAELSTMKLKSEEEKLSKLKNDIMKERSMLERQKEQASEELLQADSWRNLLRETQEDIQREKMSLQVVAAELQDMSNKLVERDMELEKKEQILTNLEKNLQEEKLQLQNKYNEIQHREQEISLLYEHTNSQRLAMKNMEEEILNKRRTLSNQRKELSKLQFYETYNQLNPSYSTSVNLPQSTAIVPSHLTNSNPFSQPSNPYYPSVNTNLNTQFQSNSNYEKENYPSYSEVGLSNSGVRGNDQQFDYNMMNSFYSQQQQQPHQQQHQYSTSPSMKQNVDMSLIEQELYSAKKVMEVAKEEIKKTSSINKKSNSFIQNENSFLQRIQRKNY